ncbi:YciI-like protein [Bowmanella dokdonensis]|uniref:YciI family protein n=1 Tax=Bowmanella dokdonensis TaxID=751969 RepID=A0A939ISR7_9ALTE|nr:YciI-like protein [Bowmanella dokdonensis]MBN7827012.1 YciI family protein [Bowmanella dokdonensis]
MYYLLTYQVVDNYLERRATYRADHIALAKAATERGELLAGGATAEPVDKALLLFKGDSPEVAEAFAHQDPYVVNGLVKSWQVQPWHIVIGAGLEPVRFP